MKKIFTLALALGAISAMAMAAPKTIGVDCGKQAKISATAKTGYHFVRWNDNNTENPRIISVDNDTLFKAFFAINRYTIVFNNWNDTALQVDTLDHGSVVSFRGETPTKPSTAQYSYTFDGWSPTIKTPAEGDAVYKAQFKSEVNKYEIAFLNWDSTVLQSSAWEYGQTPTYDGPTPTKPATTQATYAFKGWDKQIKSVTGEATYVAQFDSTVISYQISVTPNDASFGSTSGSGVYVYGQEVEISATPNECYEFVQWNDGDTNATRTITVTGVATYTATFRKIQYQVTVESDDENMGTADVETVTE